jgi:simple sugar transport system permease protein
VHGWAAPAAQPLEMADTTAAHDERLIRLGVVTRLLNRPDVGALAGAVAVFALFAYFATKNGNKWLSWGDAVQWTDTSAQYGIVAVPVALLMIGGEFDLSAGVMIGSTGLLLGYLATYQHLDIWAAIPVVLLFGAAVGFVNGFTVVKTKLPSFIVTLGTFFILQGLNAALTIKLTGATAIENLDSASGFNSAYRWFSSTFWSPHDFKVKVIWWIGFTAVGAWVLARTRFGNWIFAVGGDRTAARSLGVPVAFTKIVLFVTTSVVASLLGIIEALELRSTQAAEGIGREFYFIISAVVGGCLLTGGYGSVIGASLGAAILGMGSVGIIFAAWDSNYTYTFLGGILMLAVLLNTAIRARAQKGR